MLKKIFKWLPGVLISVFVIIYLLSVVRVEDVSAAFKRLTIETILFYIVIQIIALIGRAKGWQALLGKVDTLKTFFVVTEGYLFNNLIPRSGEIVRAIIMGGISSMSVMHVLSTIVVERIFDLILAAVLFLTTLPLAVQMTWMKPIAVTLLGGVFILLAILFVAAYNQEKSKTVLNILGEKWHFFKAKIKPELFSALSGLSVLTQPRSWLSSLFWISISWAAWTCMMFIAIRTIKPDAPFWWAIFCQGMLALGIALPSAPAGLGVFEGTIVVALSIFKVPQADALGMALGLHFTQILMNMVYGLIGLFKQGQNFSEIFGLLGKKSVR